VADAAGRTRVAIAQIPQSGDMAVNLAEIRWATEQARAARAELVCFPECALTGYGPIFHPSSCSFEARALRRALTDARRMARAAGVAMILGTHLPSNGGWKNSVLAIRRSGRTLGRYDKAHLYGRDAEYYLAGTAPAKVIRLGALRIGMQICFDLRFPEPFRALALRGAEVVIVPAVVHGEGESWKAPVIEAHVRSRAAENGRFVIFVNAAGRWQNAPSCVADPRGELIARIRRGARRVVTLSIDPLRVRDDFLRCRRTELYAMS